MGAKMLYKCFFIVLLSGFGYLAHGDELIELNRVVAQVNDKVVTWGEIEQAVNLTNYSRKEKLKLASQLVSGKVDRLLSRVAFENKGFALPESYIDQEFSSKLTSQFDGKRRQFRNELRSKGQTPIDYRNELEEDIIHMHMLSQIRRTSAEISPHRVEDYYNENLSKFYTPKEIRIREIQFTEDDQEGRPAKAQAFGVYDLLVKGNDFNTLAATKGNSVHIEKSGDWGYFVTPDEVPVEFRDIIFSLEHSEFSEPLPKKSSGNSVWLIFKIEEVKPSELLDIDEVREEIENFLANKLKIKAERKWLNRTKRDSFVKVELPE